MAGVNIYGGRDPRELAAYTVAEAARYLQMPVATVRSWVVGRTYPRQQGVGSFEPLISPAAGEGVRLSFNNLVEAHVLRAIRVHHAVPIKAVRPALGYAEQQLGIQRLLLSRELLTHGGELFLERFGSLINLSRSGQLVIKRLLQEHLQRVERDERSLPTRLYPFMGSESASAARPVVIDPAVSFGQPTLAGYGVRTSVLVRRIDAGESVQHLAADYGVPAQVVEQAVMFEQAA